jgi:hypothetical protein
LATKKTTCDAVLRRVAGKTRDEIMDAIYVEFGLPRPRVRAERRDQTAKPTSPKAPRKVKS